MNMVENEKRLIDANALMKAIKSFRWFGVPNTLKLMFDYLKIIIRDQPTVDAVEVSRLGKLGRLMMPYKGCPRGRVGARGIYGGEEFQTELEVMELDAIEDIEGDQWVPVLAEDLNNLKARINNAVEVVHGRWIEEEEEQWLAGLVVIGYRCSVCGSGYGCEFNYCPNCGAKMDGDGNG